MSLLRGFLEVFWKLGHKRTLEREKLFQSEEGLLTSENDSSRDCSPQEEDPLLRVLT
jgi:hypothetical protein